MSAGGPATENLQVSAVSESQQPSLQGHAADAVELCTVSQQEAAIAIRFRTSHGQPISLYLTLSDTPSTSRLPSLQTFQQAALQDVNLYLLQGLSGLSGLQPLVSCLTTRHP